MHMHIQNIEFAKASAVSYMLFNLTFFDLIGFAFGFTQLGVTVAVVWGYFGKYLPMIRDKRKQKVYLCRYTTQQ